MAKALGYEIKKPSDIHIEKINPQRPQLSIEYQSRINKIQKMIDYSMIFSGASDTTAICSATLGGWLPDFLEELQKQHPELTGDPIWEADLILTGSPLQIFLDCWEDYYRQWVLENFNFSFRSQEMSEATVPNKYNSRDFRKINTHHSFDKIFQGAMNSGVLYLYTSRWITAGEFKTINAMYESGTDLDQPIPEEHLQDKKAISGLCDLKMIELRNGIHYLTHKSQYYKTFAEQQTLKNSE